MKTQVQHPTTAGRPSGPRSLHARCAAGLPAALACRVPFGYALAGVLLACALLSVAPAGAQAAGCPNEEFRTGPSASLPDCRAYELVTPAELGRSQAMTFSAGNDGAIPSPDGEHLVLTTYAPFEPNPSITGTRAVYSRTPQGWTATSIATGETGAREIALNEGYLGILSPELSQVAFSLEVKLNKEERVNVPDAFEVGPVGGPYTVMAAIPNTFRDTAFIAGANAGNASVAAFTDVVLESEDHQLLPEGPERKVAEEAQASAQELYEWSEGKLRLVNVEGEGANVKKLNTCDSGELGVGQRNVGPRATGAVSADGSMIFFSSCGRLYMRVDGRETVEIAAPAPGVELNASERGYVRYDAASMNSPEVVFNTSTPLLEGESDSQNKLFVYNTVTRELKLISENAIYPIEGTEGHKVIISEDGSAVYYESGSGSIYRYDTQTGQTSFVAVAGQHHLADETYYTTPNGQFLLFADGGEPPGVEFPGPHGLPELQSEPRGEGYKHNEFYRYDAADGSVLCVSCGEGVAPAVGQTEEPDRELGVQDQTPPFISISEDGQRVFFETTARLVPQDTNSTEEGFGTTGKGEGMDVYEWEADGTKESPGVVCAVANGCTHLISTGEDVGAATFLGASENGDNVFFATAGQLLPQVDGEFPNIYDARVDGGFPPPSGEPECLSCQGVGAPAPLFSAGASLTFVGVGNPVQPAAATGTHTKTKTKMVKCGKGDVKRKGRCVAAKVKHGKKVKRASRGARR